MEQWLTAREDEVFGERAQEKGVPFSQRRGLSLERVVEIREKYKLA